MNNILFLLPFGLLAAVFWFYAGSPQNPFMRKWAGNVLFVIDGGSLRLNDVRQRVVLWGVTAPAIGESGYEQAKLYLSKLTYCEYLECREVLVDLERRIVARCYRWDGAEINKLMIDSGLCQECPEITKGFYSARAQAG